jgi:hypothetical protein
MNRAATTLLLLLGCGAALGQSGAVNGFVRDATSGEALAYCNVYLDGTEYGAATSDKGYYYVGHVAPGRYTLAASFVGYKTAKKSITVVEGQTLKLDMELLPGTIEVGEVKVTAERARFEREVQVSAVRLDPKQISFIPKVGGEVDLFRTIQTLPGVVATSDFSNRLYIRGGSPDQNLILLDGITVYNPSHLFGVFSPFIPEAVSDVTLLAGGFPAKYGGRLSSVLDVTTKEGNSKRFTGQASASVIAATAQVEGPIPHGSFLLAGRRTYLPDLLLSAFGVKGVGYYFYDVMGKVNYEPWPDSKFTLAGIAAEDVLSFWDPENRDALDANMRWGNRGLSARWNGVISPVLYGEAVGAWSNFHSDFEVDFGASSAPSFRTDLTDFQLKTNLTWYWADRHTLEFGAEARSTQVSASFTFDTMNITNRDTLWPLALYADEKWELVPEQVFLKPGVRLAWDPYKQRFETEPRLGVKYKPWENTAFSAAVGRFTQPMVTLNSTDALFSIYDIWVSAPGRFELPSATHYIAGVEHWLRHDAIVQLEGYYKDYNELLETHYGDYFTPPDSLLSADGYSYGAEAMLRKTAGPVNGWLSYSYMWTRRSIGREVYHPHYDRRHSLNVITSFPRLFWGVDVSAKWTLGTGLPYAGTIGYYEWNQFRPDPDPSRWVMNYWEYVEGTRDAFRYPLYHRLDAGASRTWLFKWGELTAFLDVTNLYNAKNVLIYYWEDDKATGLPVRRQIGNLPILPTIGVKVKF